LTGIGAALLFVAIATIPFLAEEVPKAFERATSDWQRARDARPPKDLPLRRSDFDRFPRDSFGFVYEERGEGGGRVSIDTFRGSATRRWPTEPESTVVLRFTDAELDTIYRAMITNRLFDSSESHPPGGQATSLLPWHEIGLLARAGSAERHLRWSTEDCPRSTDPWKRLYSIVNLIRRIAQSHSEYQALIAKRLASA